MAFTLFTNWKAGTIFLRFAFTSWWNLLLQQLQLEVFFGFALVETEILAHFSLQNSWSSVRLDGEQIVYWVHALCLVLFFLWNPKLHSSFYFRHVQDCPLLTSFHQFDQIPAPWWGRHPHSTALSPPCELWGDRFHAKIPIESTEVSNYKIPKCDKVAVKGFARHCK